MRVLILLLFPLLLFSQKDSLSISIENGRILYDDFCIRCHLPNGKGQIGIIPPLAKSDFLYEHICECAEEIDSFEINLNEDPSEYDEYNVYTYIVRGMKGVFFIESQDEGPLFFENYENAKNYISMNFGIEFNENNEVDKKSLENRIDGATAIKRVIRIMDKLEKD